MSRRPAWLSAMPLTLVLVWCCSAGWAQTQTRESLVYRCGPEGRDLRSSPCPERPDAPPDSVRYEQPSAAQARDARERAQAERRQAERMERERLAQELRQRRAAGGAVGIHGRGQPASAAAPAKPAGKDPRQSDHKPVRPKPPTLTHPPARGASAAKG